MRIGEYIKKLRKTEMLTQQGFSERLCVKRSYISELESGKKNPSVRLISSICREFRVNMEWLKHGKGQMYENTPRFSPTDNTRTYEILTANRDSIGKRIEELRCEQKLSQAKFAKKISRDRSLITRIEAGISDLSPSVSMAICNVFGVRRAWLHTGNGEVYENRWTLLERRAEELGSDISRELITLKATKTAHEALLKGIGSEGMKEVHNALEKEYLDKLLTIFKNKDEETISTITHSINTCLKVPDKKKTKKTNHA